MTTGVGRTIIADNPKLYKSINVEAVYHLQCEALGGNAIPCDTGIGKSMNFHDRRWMSRVTHVVVRHQQIACNSSHSGYAPAEVAGKVITHKTPVAVAAGVNPVQVNIVMSFYGINQIGK